MIHRMTLFALFFFWFSMPEADASALEKIGNQLIQKGKAPFSDSQNRRLQNWIQRWSPVAKELEAKDPSFAESLRKKSIPAEETLKKLLTEKDAQSIRRKAGLRFRMRSLKP